MSIFQRVIDITHPANEVSVPLVPNPQAVYNGLTPADDVKVHAAFQYTGMVDLAGDYPAAPGIRFRLAASVTNPNAGQDGIAQGPIFTWNSDSRSPTWETDCKNSFDGLVLVLTRMQEPQNFNSFIGLMRDAHTSMTGTAISGGIQNFVESLMSPSVP